MDRLLGHHWPGNVRELQNVIGRRASFFGPTITTDVISLTSVTAPADASSASTSTTVTLEAAPRRAVLAAMADTNWRISGLGRAADVLALTPRPFTGK
ncbi:hypothetical protein BH24ACI4_BH24ACI4_13330 [soil metagenome]